MLSTRSGVINQNQSRARTPQIFIHFITRLGHSFVLNLLCIESFRRSRTLLFPSTRERLSRLAELAAHPQPKHQRPDERDVLKKHDHFDAERGLVAQRRALVDARPKRVHGRRDDEREEDEHLRPQRESTREERAAEEFDRGGDIDEDVIARQCGAEIDTRVPIDGGFDGSKGGGDARHDRCVGAVDAQGAPFFERARDEEEREETSSEGGGGSHRDRVKTGARRCEMRSGLLKRLKRKACRQTAN